MPAVSVCLLSVPEIMQTYRFAASGYLLFICNGISIFIVYLDQKNGSFFLRLNGNGVFPVLRDPGASQFFTVALHININTASSGGGTCDCLRRTFHRTDTEILNVLHLPLTLGKINRIGSLIRLERILFLKLDCGRITVNPVLGIGNCFIIRHGSNRGTVNLNSIFLVAGAYILVNGGTVASG